MKEKIFCFHADHMNGFSKNLPGLSTLSKDLSHLKYFCAAQGFFENRQAAENKEELKQLIPYVVIRRGEQILTYKRSKKSGEGRLHDKWSVGIGGHINPVDLEPYQGTMNMICRAIGRELDEELDWGEIINCTVNNISEHGVLYDNSNAVGKVHIGYVLTVDVPQNQEYPKAKENTIAACEWMSPRDAIKLPNLEEWSRIVLEAMMGVQTKTTS